jgi:predicted lipoprotein with Yx(FWY)xxD motif
MNRPGRRLAWVVAAAAAVLALGAAQAIAARSAVVVLSATNASLGKILVSADGRTLYHTSGEPKNVVRCTGACASDWSPLVVSAGAKPVAGAGVRASLLGTVKRPDGKIQITYAGMPLYLYAGDKKAGSIEGQGIGGVHWLGGSWNAVTPAGTVVKAVAPASPGSSSTTNPGSAEPAPGMTCYY